MPNVLYRWKIWTAGRPIQHPDSSTTKPCCCNSCSMWFCIVLLKYTRPSFLHDRALVGICRWHGGLWFTDNGFWKYSWAHLVMSMTESCRWVMQCRLRARRSRASNKGLRPGPLRTEISPVSLNLLMMLCTVDQTRAEGGGWGGCLSTCPFSRGLLPDPSPTGPEILSGFGSGSG